MSNHHPSKVDYAQVLQNLTPFPLCTPRVNLMSLYIIIAMSEIGLRDSSKILYDDHQAVATKLRKENGLRTA